MLLTDTHFEAAKGGILRMDQKKRISIGPVARKGEATYFQLYRNRSGQILLNPLVPVEAARTPLVGRLNTLSSALLKPGHIERISQVPRQTLIDEAVRRGCTYFAAYSEDNPPSQKLSEIPSEVVACGLLRGDLPQAFDAIRIGAMLMSARNINPAVVWLAALSLGVIARTRWIADLGARHDSTNPNWALLLTLLPSGAKDPDDAPTEGMPGVSRLAAETWFPKRVTRWLRPTGTSQPPGT